MKYFTSFNETKELQNTYMQYLKNVTIPLPRIIHIETRSKCNSTCAFCPASINNDTRKDIYIPQELINKILKELGELDYLNRLSFYNNNEPFLDERIFSIIKQARERIPRVYLELKSNGIVLNTEKAINIFNSGLDMLYITYYSKDGEFSDNVKTIMQDFNKIRRFKGHLEEGRYFSRVIITLRYTNKVAGSRAGTSPNKILKGGSLKKMCFRPFEMMTISPEGYVSTCSEDFYYTIRMGDIEKQSLLEIWTSQEWNLLRDNLISGNRSFTDPCSKCDYKGFTYEMLMENRLYKIILWLRVKNSVKRIILFFMNKFRLRS